MIDTPFPNQPPPYGDRNLYADDVAMREAVAREGAAWAEPTLAALGERWGAAATLALAERANRFAPVHRPYDARGERIDRVEFDASWDALMTLALESGEHCAPWREPREGAHVARAAQVMLHAQAENGTQCPVTMTFACVPVLRRHVPNSPRAVAPFLARALEPVYDPSPLPIEHKRGALLGMGMTERQGGSDVRSNRTHARRSADGSARLTGHKWFFSVPQADAHLVLAREAAGVSCFLLPRLLPDGTRNAITVQRLKDKLGNRSNASSEVEFDDAWALPLGQSGRGIPTILEMVRYTRLDCALGSAGILRAALARAIHHARHRIAFGRRLVEQPLMSAVLADLALESEAATMLVLHLARLFEAPEGTPEAALAHLLTPAVKLWICKRGPALAAEAMEVLGGNGYVEDSGLPRLYRELPVNSIWEGSGNVMALDVQRVATREPDAVAALLEALAPARGADRDLDATLDALPDLVSSASPDPRQARIAAQAIVLGTQAALLVRYAPPAVAEAFCASRLAATRFGGAILGTLPAGVDTRAIVARAMPA